MSISQDAVSQQKPQDKDDEKKQVGAESESSEPKGQELVYTARISLDQTVMDIDDHMVDLEPGMAVSAEIKTGSRHIIGYLLSPIRKHMSQAMHER